MSSRRPARRENPPEEVDIQLIGREIFTQEPRVTKIPITWDNVAEIQPPVVEEIVPAFEDDNSRSLGVE